ncbi:MAG: LysE family transporter [Bowdeniella nasicola]|nr:LysE family transporter [Bowdeniella nasicola]
MSVGLWSALLVTFTIAVISPGPDFLAVLRQSLTNGRRAGIATGGGIAVGTIVWIAATMIGIVGLINASEAASLTVRLIGALFLIGYGMKIVMSLWRSRSDGGGELSAHLRLPGQKSPATAAVWRGFRLGFLTNTVGNPKAVVFFSSLFASMLPPEITRAEQVMLAAIMVTIAFTWFTLVSTLASSEYVLQFVQRIARPLDWILGVLFIILGLVLLPWSRLV